MRYFSMFSGIGGFELGIKRSQPEWECIGFSEIDKYAVKTYKTHFPDHKNYGDATTINPEELPDFEMLCGGFPCQAFSIAGKRMGFEDTRGTLFFDIARIIKVKRPRILFLENVKGLLNHAEGRTIATILATLDELGYNAEWEVLNSKYFGVPQNRERVFIIGHLRGGSGRQIFPIGNSTRKIDASRESEESVYALTSTYHKGDRGAYIKQMNNPSHSQQRVYDPSGISPTIAAGNRGGGKSPSKIVCPVLTPDRPEKRQNGRKFKEDGEEMFTLTGQDKHGVSDGSRIRRLTPLECERLQGFPDNWTVGSDTQRYKQCGNAVTVNVIEAIAERLIT